MMVAGLTLVALAVLPACSGTATRASRVGGPEDHAARVPTSTVRVLAIPAAPRRADIGAAARKTVAAIAKLNGRPAPGVLTTRQAVVDDPAKTPEGLARATVTLASADGHAYQMIVDAATGEAVFYRDQAAYKKPNGVIAAKAPASEETALRRIDALFPGRSSQLRPRLSRRVVQEGLPTEYRYGRVIDGVETDDFLDIGVDAGGDVVYFMQQWAIDPGEFELLVSRALPKDEIVRQCAAEASVTPSALTATLRYRTRLLPPDRERGRPRGQWVQGLFYYVESEPWSAAVDAGTGEVIERMFHD
jgi:hypothetical protein